MNSLVRAAAALALSFAFACGGQVEPTSKGDAAPDAPGSSDAAAPPTCHGFCPQPNGSPCASDCDCDNKCLFGTDTNPMCADPIAPTVSCADASACPQGQSCSVFGTCEGAPCTSSNECPSKEQCMSGACAVVGCL